MRAIIILLLFFVTKYILSKPIDTETDALKYLTKLGYNTDQCKESSKLACSISSSSIIRKYQKTFGLKETGQLDKSTSELLNKPRCGNSDAPKSMVSSISALHNFKWNKNHLKWTLRNPSSLISHDKTNEIIREAFEAWTKYIPLTIENVCENCQADVIFDFAHGDHDDHYAFDGPGHTLAHAFMPQDGRVHFDASERWTEKFDGKDYNLFLIAVHEIGHALGLDHNTLDRSSIMFPSYQFMDKHRILPNVDQRSIIDKYGSKSSTKTLTPYHTMIVVLKNKATSRVLYSNRRKSVYTLNSNGGDYQKWELIEQDDDIYVLRNVATSLVLDSEGGRTSTKNSNGHRHQRWRFIQQNDGSYILKNVANSRVLESNDVGGVYSQDSDNDDQQKWILEES